MVCSGGTTSRCAADGHWTLDLREKYQGISYSPINQTVEICAGVKMANLLKKLSKHKRSFPTGLSGLPGLGYILSGGISPFSRSQGLAIDHILSIEGLWGKGKSFNYSKPTIHTGIEEKKLWRGLCGAAHFLGIITKVNLKTQPLKPIEIWQSYVDKDGLIQAIIQAEKWPNSHSLQWIWHNNIKVYAVINDNNPNREKLKSIQVDFPCSSSMLVTEVQGLQKLPDFTSESYDGKKLRLHSEVVGVLGASWGENCRDLIQSLSHLMSRRPNQNCFIAAQQLGGVTTETSRSTTSFIHRQAIWKPWINASWEAGNEKAKEKSLCWLKEVWEELDPHCPGIHLAQMHQHLPWHQEETRKAFKEWLPGLQELKSRYDPQCILPRL